MTSKTPQRPTPKISPWCCPLVRSLARPHARLVLGWAGGMRASVSAVPWLARGDGVPDAMVPVPRVLAQILLLLEFLFPS